MAFTPIDPNKAEVRITGEAPNYGLDFYIPRGERGAIGPTGPQGPAVPTNLSIGTIEVGPAAPGTIGPQGIQGVKGDPGGFVAPTNIGVTTDLNSLIVSGLYASVGNQVNTVRNYPVTFDSPFVMEVIAGTSNSGVQMARFTFAARAGQVEYVRTWSNSGATWTAWKTIGASRVDQTAGRAIYQWDDLNNREQLIYGDTGARAVGDILLNGWTSAAADNVLIRRVNSTISLTAKMSSTAATDDIFFTVPVGFRPRTQDQVIIQSAASAALRYARAVWNGNLYVVRTPSDSTVYVSGTWMTTDAWPTTLPGVSNGTVPNT